VVKWKIPTENHATVSEELLLDWEHRAIDVYIPNHFHSEVISAFLRAQRRGRLSADEAGEAIRDLLALPFVVCDVAPIAERAFAIAQQHNQRAYDCLYVALAERESIELWTGDHRLYNALHAQYALVQWIADYQRHRSADDEPPRLPAA
jgi:predicted nucleic acid-binding protein